MVARLDGGSIDRDFDRYNALVEKGIAGFIVFGGELEALRVCLRKLQESSDMPLIIASDLEQGLGQQVGGGTLFPPAIALTSAIHPQLPQDVVLLQDIFTAYAEETLYAGINTILAPVVDVNTNPENPVISVRSYGEDHGTVSFMAGQMIETIQSNGVITCAKHFPGHGDSDIDSHLELPLVNKDLAELDSVELCPFRSAIDKGVWAIMLGHLACPAIDERGVPLSVSKKAVEFIRNDLRFDGILMTDAMNMGGLSSIGQNKAGLMALNAGVDILLHPSDVDDMNSYLHEKNAPMNSVKIAAFRSTLKTGSDERPDFKKNHLLSVTVTERSITIKGEISSLNPSIVVVIKEDDRLASGIVEKYIKDKFPDTKCLEVTNGEIPDEAITGNRLLTVIFSTTSAWKGSPPDWFIKSIRLISNATQLFVVLGNPYVVHGINRPKIFAWSCSELVELEVVKKLKELLP